MQKRIRRTACILALFALAASCTPASPDLLTWLASNAHIGSQAARVVDDSFTQSAFGKFSLYEKPLKPYEGAPEGTLLIAANETGEIVYAGFSYDPAVFYGTQNGEKLASYFLEYANLSIASIGQPNRQESSSDFIYEWPESSLGDGLYAKLEFTPQYYYKPGTRVYASIQADSFAEDFKDP